MVTTFTSLRNEFPYANIVHKHDKLYINDKYIISCYKSCDIVTQKEIGDGIKFMLHENRKKIFSTLDFNTIIRKLKTDGVQ